MKPLLLSLGGPKSGAAALLRHAAAEVRTYSDWRTKHMLGDIFEIDENPQAAARVVAYADRRLLALADRALAPPGVLFTRAGLSRPPGAPEDGVCVDLAILDPFYAPGSGAEGPGGWPTRRLVATLAAVLADRERAVRRVFICGYVQSGDRNGVALAAATAVIQTVAEIWR